ncbi:tetratricopeptide repeat protein [Phocaeicola sp.]
MKALFYLIGFLFLFATGCSQSSHSNLSLDKVEQMLLADPDSAAILLNGMEAPESLNDEDFARWCMLSGKVTDETIEGLLPVYQWQRAQNWFLKHGTPEEQAQVALYLGRAYAEDGEYDKAMETYTHALLFAKEHKEYNVAGYICTYMADLYSFRDMSDQSLKKQEEASELFKKAQNWKSYAYSLKNLAVEWAYIDSFACAVTPINLAESIAAQLHINNLNKAIANAQGNIYMMKGEYDKAIPYFIKATQIKGNESIKDSLALTMLYIKSDKLSKAKDILNNISYNPTMSYGINKVKYMLYKTEGNYKEALHYKEICSDILDSITIAQNKTKVLEIEKKYHNLKLREENTQLKVKQQKYIILIIIALSISILMILGYSLYRQKVRSKIYIQQAELDKTKAELTDLSTELKEKKSLLESTINDKDEYVGQLKQEINNLSARYHRLQKQKLTTSSTGSKLTALTQKSPTGKTKAAITPKLWLTITREVETTYPRFYTNLLNQCPNLTEQDWQYCCLHIFDFDGNDEAKLLDINPDSVRMKRSRLKQKLNIQLPEDISLRDFLVEYLLN